jgi:DNA polymerase sigma
MSSIQDYHRLVSEAANREIQRGFKRSVEDFREKTVNRKLPKKKVDPDAINKILNAKKIEDKKRQQAIDDKNRKEAQEAEKKERAAKIERNLAKVINTTFYEFIFHANKKKCF